jgi:hypothetical protein
MLQNHITTGKDIWHKSVLEQTYLLKIPSSSTDGFWDFVLFGSSSNRRFKEYIASIFMVNTVSQLFHRGILIMFQEHCRLGS